MFPAPHLLTFPTGLPMCVCAHVCMCVCTPMCRPKVGQQPPAQELLGSQGTEAAGAALGNHISCCTQKLASGRQRGKATLQTEQDTGRGGSSLASVLLRPGHTAALAL